MTAPVFANSAEVDAVERLVLRGGSWRRRALAVRYGLLISERAGPVLIDTGYTPHALAGPGRSLGLRAYGRALGPRLLDGGQPEPVLARFGLRPEDVARVIVTHFHADHVSGLALFPKARFLASRDGWAALRGRSRMGNLRHGIFPELLPSDFADRLDLVEATAPVPLPGVPGGMRGHDILGDGSMLSLPLPGHAEGQFGLVFPALARPLLYAVDAQWLAAALPATRRPGYPSRLIAADRAALDRSSDLVERFAGDVVLCHDPTPSPYDLGPACA
jgi:glyoxylase-like metal-dependent hydrolase (beta-lactamase superfamily II)